MINTQSEITQRRLVLILILIVKIFKRILHLKIFSGKEELLFINPQHFLSSTNNHKNLKILT